MTEIYIQLGNKIKHLEECKYIHIIYQDHWANYSFPGIERHTHFPFFTPFYELLSEMAEDELHELYKQYQQDYLDSDECSAWEAYFGEPGFPDTPELRSELKIAMFGAHCAETLETAAKRLSSDYGKRYVSPRKSGIPLYMHFESILGPRHKMSLELCLAEEIP